MTHRSRQRLRAGRRASQRAASWSASLLRRFARPRARLPERRRDERAIDRTHRRDRLHRPLSGAANCRKRGYRVRVLLRRPAEVPPGASSAVIGDIASPRNMAAALRDVDAVIHSAGLAHAMSGLPEDDYRTINTQATIDLARAAERARVKRFVFLSSIRAQTGPVPLTLLTEDATSRARQTPMAARSSKPSRASTRLAIDWVALRPVLVYGPGVKGNMAALLRLARNRPGRCPSARSMPSARCSPLDNLASAIDAVLREPGPLRRPFIVADPEPLDVAGASSRALRAGSAAGRVSIPVPPFMLRLGARLPGATEAFERVAGSLVAQPRRVEGPRMAAGELDARRTGTAGASSSSGA